MATGAHIKVDQSGLSAGVYDRGRDDVRSNSQLTLTADVSSGQETVAWTLTAKPEGSSAAIADATSAVATLTADIPGETYLVQLAVDDGLGANVQTVAIRATKDANENSVDARLVLPGADEDRATKRDGGKGFWAYLFEAIMGHVEPTVANITTLKTTFPRRVKRVRLLGASTLNDGGGGVFVWNSTSTKTENLGTVVQVTGVATGRWERVYAGEVDVQWFGAAGDGVADDTVFVQAASVAAGSSGTIRIREGRTYRVNANWNLTAGKLVIDGQAANTGILVDAGKTLTITAEVVAPPDAQIFYPLGTIKLVAPRGLVSAAWWGTQATTNATPKTALAFSLPTGKQAALRVSIQARRTGGGAAGSVDDWGLWIRDVVFRGSNPIVNELDSAARATVQAGLTGITTAVAKGTGAQEVNVNVTGLANVNLTWDVVVERVGVV